MDVAFESVQFAAECLAVPDGWSDEEKNTTHYTHTTHSFAGRICTSCGVTSTPQWREGPEGPKTLCNACGVKWYRAAKKTRKVPGGNPKPNTVKKPLSSKPLPSKRSRRPASHFDISSEEDEMDQPSQMVSGDSDDSEEHVAALSLLSFAGAKAQLMAATLLGGPPTAPNSSMPPAPPTTAPVQLPPAVPLVPSTSVALALDPASAFNMVSSLLPSKEQSHLRQLHAAVQEAYRELQAADAAAMAVAAFLNEKQRQALAARQRAEAAGMLLLQEIKQMGAPPEIFGPPLPSAAIASAPKLIEDYPASMETEP